MTVALAIPSAEDQARVRSGRLLVFKSLTSFYVSCFIKKQSYNLGVIIIPILQINKLRLGEVTCPRSYHRWVEELQLEVWEFKSHLLTLKIPKVGVLESEILSQVSIWLGDLGEVI